MFLLVLASASYQYNQGEVASSWFPPLEWKEQSKTYLLPKGQVSVLLDLQFNEKKLHNLDLTLGKATEGSGKLCDI